MNLRLIRTIFFKDARRLRWMIALTLVMLARLAHDDNWRDVAIPGKPEGWLNLVLPLAWSVLIALAVLEDPGAGDSPFWMTAPCRWTNVFASKVLFAAVFIHLPYLIACGEILSARGFSPSSFTGVLAERQLSVLALVLASIAVASLVRNITRFLMVAIAVAAVCGAPMAPQYLAESPGHVRYLLVSALMLLAAIRIAMLQYARKATRLSRRAGIATLVFSVALWFAPLSRVDSLLENAVSPAAPAEHPEIGVSQPGEDRLSIQSFRIWRRGGGARIAIPLALRPIPGYTLRLREVSLNIVDANGRRYNAAIASRLSDSDAGASIVADLQESPDSVRTWQQMSIERKEYLQMRGVPVTLEGVARVEYLRTLNAVVLRPGRSALVQGAGRCSAAVMEPPQDESLRIACESPDDFPDIRTDLIDPLRDRRWHVQLASSRPVLRYPTRTWLSPVKRAASYISLIDEEHSNMGNREWELPREALDTLEIAITPAWSQGSSQVPFTLRNIRLSDYEVKP